MIRKLVFHPGDVIFNEGDASMDAYRVLRGRVEISTKLNDSQKVVLAALTVGDVFGEMAMIDESPRSATVTSLDETEVEVMSPDDFNKSFLRDPYQLTPYLSALIERLRTTNERLRMLTRQLDSMKAGATEKPEKRISLTRFPIDQAADTNVKYKLRITANNPHAEKTCTPYDFVTERFPYRIGRATLTDTPDILQKNDMGLRNVDPMLVARNHCIIDQDKSAVFVRDRGSKTGCIVNGVPIGEKAKSCDAKLNLGENLLIIGGQNSYVEFKLNLIKA